MAAAQAMKLAATCRSASVKVVAGPARSGQRLACKPAVFALPVEIDQM